jgi:beta-lactamase superfamily II metal-dependent hydrolase
MIFVTNPDSDHYEGFIKFLDKYSVGGLVESGTTNSYSAFVVFQEKIKEKGITKTLARRGLTSMTGNNANSTPLFAVPVLE